MLNLLFGFKGRINRAQYWTGCVIAGVLGGVAFVAVGVSTGLSLQDAKGKGDALQAVLGLFALLIPIWGVLCWASMALQVKRFHDRGRSGLFTLAPAIPAVLMTGSIMSSAISGAPVDQALAAAQPFMMLLWIVNLAMLVDLGFMPSKEGPNKYGDQPGSPGGGSAPAPTNKPAPKAAPSYLGGAEAAMQRAIAEQARRPQVGPRPAVATAGAAPAGAAPSFGRRPAQ